MEADSHPLFATFDAAETDVDVRSPGQCVEWFESLLEALAQNPSDGKAALLPPDALL